ncbi:glutamate--cysteine ligase family protein [Halanaeroarchaeum sulfurireducens]|uniref:Glutamate--cysteine ligase n=1 Tax=Halanaeroarchaeum sulfurireducens TaxID=1604004 RepID=A0A0F7PD71_9EURY|nr:hypothetical protein [Halanaeroarchaeum sulfurireducens]AKH97273.1 hypothetical protein HLASF_0778 [Halanaeroarchaeum sulfurireducens]ALG81675.1 hypothetical protein HLASA_0775 [Halanaeroarchaeum sulfurireducens]
METPVDLVARSVAEETRAEFEERVRANAAFLREELEDGRLDNADPTIGLELECYAVTEDGRLVGIPEGTFETTPVNRELGRHNIEVNTTPQVLGEEGVTEQAAEIADHLATARNRLEDEGLQIALDAMWTVPPAQGSWQYLEAVEEKEGLVFAENMYPSARYYALDNDILRDVGGEIDLDVPGVRRSFPTILLESLATSMQPHLQVSSVDTFPAYYNASLRTLAPVLALATNSPFLPGDLYGDADPDRLLAETFHELRVPVFEQSINAGRDPGKVRFPRDIHGAEDVIDRVVADHTVAPFFQEWVETGDDEYGDDYADEFWEFDHKHGTYWRWVRGVIGGEFVDPNNDERSLRIEYRPLPTQPSVRDVVGFQLLVVGLLRGLVAADHPVSNLGWERARADFYAVVEDGLDAEIHWVTEAGEHTTDLDVIYGELFAFARRGLREADVSGTTIDRYLDPIERRWTDRTTPSRWKIERVRDEISAGKPLTEAITSMQRAYVEHASNGEPFSEWG